jgi:hypothetical protein
MEPEGSLQSSQEPLTGPYPKQSLPPHPIPLTSIQYPLTYVQVFLVASFLLAFPQKPYAHSFSPMRATHAAHLILLIILITFG